MVDPMQVQCACVSQCLQPRCCPDVCRGKGWPGDGSKTSVICLCRLEGGLCDEGTGGASGQAAKYRGRRGRPGTGVSSRKIAQIACAQRGSSFAGATLATCGGFRGGGCDGWKRPPTRERQQPSLSDRGGGRWDVGVDADGCSARDLQSTPGLNERLGMVWEVWYGGQWCCGLLHGTRLYVGTYKQYLSLSARACPALNAQHSTRAGGKVDDGWTSLSARLEPGAASQCKCGTDD